MNADNDDLRRWRDLSSDPRALTSRAADLADAVRDVPPLTSETMARIKVEVLSRRSSRAARELPVGWRFALLAGVVLASVATAKGTMILWRRHVVASSATHGSAIRRRVSPTRPTLVTRPHDEPPSASLPEETASTPIPDQPPASPAPGFFRRPPPVGTSHTRRTAMALPPETRAASDAVAPTASTTEAQILGRALSRLRQAHDPAGALALLDEYARAFPHGILESEALSARIEAVVQMNDRKTALSLLDGRSVFPGRLGSQLLLTRAELRASAGRYAEALGDFDRLLAPKGAVVASADREPALYGRAVCLGHLGWDDRARADLVAYQRTFPDGKHAAEVARLLKSAGSENRP